MKAWTITGKKLEDIKIQSYRFAAGKRKSAGAEKILERHTNRIKRIGKNND